MHPVPEYAQLNTDQEVNYLCCIKENTDFNMKFYRDKMIVIIRNCDPSTVVEIFHKKEGSSTCSQHLALVITKSKTSLLYTTGRQCTPSCSMCMAPKEEYIKE